jgi:hypothetical protein
MDPGAGHALIIEIGRRAKDKMGGAAPGSDKSDSSDESDSGAIKASAAEDIIKAVKGGDAEELASALSDFFEACSSKSYPKDGE